MAKCDLCGAQCSASEMTQLREQYQAAGVVDICQACNSWANGALDKLQSDIAPQMRLMIEDRVGRRSFWQRLVDWACR